MNNNNNAFGNPRIMSSFDTIHTMTAECPNTQVINLTTCVMDLKIEKERRHYDSYIMTGSLGGNKQSRLTKESTKYCNKSTTPAVSLFSFGLTRFFIVGSFHSTLKPTSSISSCQHNGHQVNQTPRARKKVFIASKAMERQKIS
jgi:hypothetical protein